MKKMIIKILIVLAIIIAIPLIAALFIKNEYKVEREVVIDCNKHLVFDYIKFQKNQEQYNKWVMADPAMKKDYKGTDGTVGFAYAWESEKGGVGKGEQVIKKIIDGERVETEIHFIKPFEGIGITAITTEAAAEGRTKVKWGMSGRTKYPFNFMNLFTDNILGKDLDESLVNLKSIMEKNKATAEN